MSKSNTTASASGGVGFAGLLTILFVGLKLTGYLEDWSWWWVFSPLWISFLAFVGFFLILLLVALVAAYRQVNRGR